MINKINKVQVIIEKAATTPLTREGIEKFYGWLKEFQNKYFFNGQYPHPEYQLCKRVLPHQAKLVTFDGISGSGKNTQIKLLEKRIQEFQPLKCWCRTFVTKHENPFRDILISYWKEHPATRDNHIEIPLLWAGRKYFIEEILIPELAKTSEIVLQNRSYLSDLVFMSHSVNDLEEYMKLCWFDPLPDLAIVLNADPHEAFDRVCNRALSTGCSIQPQEKLPIMKRTATLYQHILKLRPLKTVSVTADGSPEEVHARIWQHVKPVLSSFKSSVLAEGKTGQIYNSPFSIHSNKYSSKNQVKRDVSQDLRYREFNPLKIWHHADRLQALAQGQDIAPVTVELDLVAYCNHKCFWCVDPFHFKIRLEKYFVLHFLDELSAFQVNNFGVCGIVFKGGGEPTLHPDFAYILPEARKRGFEIGIVTNGSLLFQPQIAGIITEWANYIRISVDGPTPDSHYRIHQTRDFFKIVEGIKQLIALRTQRHPVIGLSFAMDYSMKNLIPEAIHMGDKLNVDYVLIRPPFFEEVGQQSTMSPEEAASLRQEFEKSAREYKGEMDVFVGNWVSDAEMFSDIPADMAQSGRREQQIQKSLPIEHRLGKCWASPLLAVITADKKVYGCCNLRFLEEWNFGAIDYKAGITFNDIWHGIQRKEILEKMHRTQCIKHCTHPLTRYNEILEMLKDKNKPHSSFV